MAYGCKRTSTDAAVQAVVTELEGFFFFFLHSKINKEHH